MKKLEFIHQKHDGSWTDKVDREIFSGAHVSTLLPYDPIRKELFYAELGRGAYLNEKKLVCVNSWLKQWYLSHKIKRSRNIQFTIINNVKIFKPVNLC